MKTLCLSGEWTLRRDDGAAFPAVLPGTDFGALIAAGEIKNPLVSGLEQEALETAAHDYTFLRSFELDAEILQCEHVHLCCDVLDTLCTVVINGQTAFETNSAFVPVDRDVKAYLREGENAIELRFRSAYRFIEKRHKEEPLLMNPNGVNGIWIMLLYLLDTFLNILCELLISKQSRYNFLVSVLVEITEIAICLVLMYRFATMAVTLFFWLPIDILSFINWTKHKDEVEDELTMVRRLKGYQEVLIIAAIAVWTVVVGYFISGLDISSDFMAGQRDLELLVIYLDACASAVGIANGLFIFFRLREQWIAWYICALLEAIINILAGQYVLLILKLGYFTNTTYGYIKWSRYIRTHKEEERSLL